MDVSPPTPEAHACLRWANDSLWRRGTADEAGRALRDALHVHDLISIFLRSRRHCWKASVLARARTWSRTSSSMCARPCGRVCRCTPRLELASRAVVHARPIVDRVGASRTMSRRCASAPFMTQPSLRQRQHSARPYRAHRISRGQDTNKMSIPPLKCHGNP